MRFRVISYNVQAPFLPSPQLRPINQYTGHPHPPPMTTEVRLQCLWRTIRNTLNANSKVPAFVCLQEVCEEWRMWFTNNLRDSYKMDCMFHNYSPAHHQPLYSMVFYQPEVFDCRIGSAVSYTGTLADNEQAERLALSSSEISINMLKRHGVLSGVFAVRANLAGPEIIVGTYHAPCIFQYPRCQQLHTENALRFVSQTYARPTSLSSLPLPLALPPMPAAHLSLSAPPPLLLPNNSPAVSSIVPPSVLPHGASGVSKTPTPLAPAPAAAQAPPAPAVVLAGDFNMLPTDTTYKRAVRPDLVIDAAAYLLGEGRHQPTTCTAEFVGCIDYVFCNSHAVPEQVGLHGFQTVPYLSESQPSDHALLQMFFKTDF